MADGKELIEKADDVENVDNAEEIEGTEETIDLPETVETEEIQALLNTIDDLSESVDALTAERDELVAKLAALSEVESKLGTAEEQCAQLEELVAELTAKLDEYEEYQVAELVDEILEIRTQLGKLTDEETDEMRAALEQRTIESLRDTLADLKLEMPGAEMPAAPPHIETIAIPGENNATIEGADEPQLSSDEIMEKGLSLLLTGWRR